MKRFDFPLESVWRWRREQADVEELKLQQLYSSLNEIAVQRRVLVSEREQAQAGVTMQIAVAAEELSRLDAFRQFVQARCQTLDALTRQQEGKIAQQRGRTIDAKRQFELLQRLRQKALLEWRAAYEKEQEEVAAELFLARRKRAVG